MRIIIKKEYKMCSQWVAEYLVEKINNFAPTKDKPFVLGLPTGSTPMGMYTHLIKMYTQNKVSFENVVSFNMDEYVGLTRTHAQSYYTYMVNNFFSHVNIKKENTYVLNGGVSDLEAECQKFEDTITSYGGIRLFVAGMGEDGHIAFNEPGSSLTSRTRVKTLMRDTRIANARFFDNNSDAVPHTALTVGVGTVMDSKEIVLLVSGYNKANALQKCIEEGLNHRYTASCLQLHSKSIVVCDDAATDELTVRTVRYFKELEGEL